MAIETTTTTTIHCDTCGREIARDAQWFQVQHTVAWSVFDGTAANLHPVSSVLVQLCETCYPKAAETIAAITPLGEQVAETPAAL